MTMDGNIYFLQYGSYISYDVMEENIKKLKDYLIVEEDDKFYVYIGAFINIEHAKEMQKKFEEDGIYTYLKNDFIGDANLIKSIKDEEKEIDENNKDLLLVNKMIMNILRNAGDNY